MQEPEFVGTQLLLGPDPRVVDVDEDHALVVGGGQWRSLSRCRLVTARA
ncbi:MAG: hypothetical protein MNPFHGCM_02960 [Gemmatimonadaceae bacterium]|nr:hypothetical protein [Gemmatimonadaceae bacterium]